MNISKLLCLIGAVICIPIYVILKRTNIDPETGFFLAENGLFFAFSIIMFVCLCGIIIYALYYMKDTLFSISNSKVLAILSLLLGVALLIDGGITIFAFYQSFSDSFELMFSSIGGVIYQGFSFIITLLSGLVFLKLSLGYFQEDITNRGSFTFLLPIIWALTCCVQLYTEYPQIAGMPDRVLLLLCLLSFTAFLVGQGRIMSNVNMNRGVTFSCGFGLCASLTGATLVAGEVATLNLGNGFAIPAYDLILCGLIALYCFSFALGSKPLFPSKKD